MTKNLIATVVVHNMFHPSILQKLVHDSNVVVSPHQIEDLEVKPEFSGPRKQFRVVGVTKNNLKIIMLFKAQ